MKRISIGLKDIFSLANGEAIIRSFLDTDFYKFSMAYFIWKNLIYRDTIVTFKLLVRDPYINIKNVISESVLREQLDECMRLALTPAERSFLGGLTLRDGTTSILSGVFLNDLMDMRHSELMALCLSIQLSNQLCRLAIGESKSCPYRSLF